MNRIKTLFGKTNLLKRVMTALALLPLILLIVYLGNMIFLATLISIAVLMAYEWHHITGQSIRWQLIGLLYIAMPIAAIIHIRNSDCGFTLILFLMLTVWATDSGAYFTGIVFGGPKIAPKVSPSKTWSGAFGGLILALIVGITFEVLHNKLSINFIRIAFITSLFAQLGDLLESYLKRYFNVKDSGSILPGHGGFLDRMDSFTLSAPIFALLV